MVRTINIDTKTRTIRISNEDGNIEAWRTTESGAHFPIKKGESTKQALDRFVEKKQGTASGTGSMSESATDWYAKKYKRDKDMAPKGTFEQLYQSLKRGEDVYEDSIVRERVFEEMSKRLNKPYDHLYDMWLHGGEKGSTARQQKTAADKELYEKLLKIPGLNEDLRAAIKKAAKRV